jgi:hypothetical protein
MPELATDGYAFLAQMTGDVPFVEFLIDEGSENGNASNVFFGHAAAIPKNAHPYNISAEYSHRSRNASERLSPCDNIVYDKDAFSGYRFSVRCSDGETRATFFGIQRLHLVQLRNSHAVHLVSDSLCEDYAANGRADYGVYAFMLEEKGYHLAQPLDVVRMLEDGIFVNVCIAMGTTRQFNVNIFYNRADSFHNPYCSITLVGFFRADNLHSQLLV